MTLIEHLEKGQVFYETDYGVTEEFVAITNPIYREEDKGWAIYGRCTEDGRRVRFYVRDGYDHYGPKLHL